MLPRRVVLVVAVSLPTSRRSAMRHPRRGCLSLDDDEPAEPAADRLRVINGAAAVGWLLALTGARNLLPVIHAGRIGGSAPAGGSVAR